MEQKDKHNQADKNHTNETQETTPTKPSNTGNPTEPTKSSSSWQIILTVIAIIAIILIFALPGERNPDQTPNSNDTSGETSTDTTGESEEPNPNNPNSIDPNESSPSTQPSGETADTGFMTPIPVGDEFVYRFNGIDWYFEPVDDSTRVAFMFEEFSRRAGSVVAFGNPYRLGTYESNCEEVATLNYNTSMHSDTPLSFVSCRNTDGTGTDLAMFQDGARVYVMTRPVKAEGVGTFSDLFERDITTIVR